MCVSSATSLPSLLHLQSVSDPYVCKVPKWSWASVFVNCEMWYADKGLTWVSTIALRLEIRVHFSIDGIGFFLSSHINSMHMNLSKLRETVKDRGAQSAAVHRVAKSQTQRSNWTMTTTGKLGIRPPHTSFWSLILHKEIFCVFSLIVTVSRLHVVLSPHKTVVNKMGPELATDSLQCIPNLQG